MIEIARKTTQVREQHNEITFPSAPNFDYC